MTIGENIKRIRLEKKLKQTDLAKKMGVSQAMIAQYEKGSRHPKIDTLDRIANALGVPLHELFKTKSLDGSTVIDLTAIEGQDINKYMDALFKIPFSGKEKRKREAQEKAKLFQTDSTGKQIVSIHADDVLSLTDEEFKLLLLYNALNADGQKKAIERVSELTEIPKYKKEETE